MNYLPCVCVCVCVCMCNPLSNVVKRNAIKHCLLSQNVFRPFFREQLQSAGKAELSPKNKKRRGGKKPLKLRVNLVLKCT